MCGITSNGGPSTSSGRTAFFYRPFDKLRACPDLIRGERHSAATIQLEYSVRGEPVEPWTESSARRKEHAETRMPSAAPLISHRTRRQKSCRLKHDIAELLPSAVIPYTPLCRPFERRPFDKLRANGIFLQALRQAQSLSGLDPGRTAFRCDHPTGILRSW